MGARKNHRIRRKTVVAGVGGVYHKPITWFAFCKLAIE
jgi:hypothetical protein